MYWLKSPLLLSFLPTTPLPAPETRTCLRCRPWHKQQPPTTARTSRYVVSMGYRRSRNRANSTRSPFSTGRRGPASISDLSADAQEKVRRAQTLWTDATSGERRSFTFSSFAVLAVAGIAINVLFHVSLGLAFALVPLVFAPVALALFVSLSAVAMLLLVTVGASAVFVGTPIMAVLLFAKMTLPLLVMGGGLVFVARRVLGIGGKNVEEVREAVGEVYDAAGGEDEAFEKFDERLFGKEGRGSDVGSWGMSDVVDELDVRGLGEYRQLFIEEKIDGGTLLGLTEQDIKVEFGSSMPLGDRMRLTRLVSDLRRRTKRVP